MRNKLIIICKALYKALPFVVALLGGGTLAATVVGCKIGSLVSLSTPL